MSAPTAPLDATGSEPPAVRLRAIRPSDATAIARLFERLDEDDRYRRWFTAVPDVSLAARRALHPSSENEQGLVAVAEDRVIGHAMLTPVDAARAEVAFEVDPAWRRHGVASHLLAALHDAAHAAGFTTLVADVLHENHDMVAVLTEHDTCHRSLHAGVVHLELPVRGRA